ncbi:hypothetical protein NQ318_016888, partial [Aromia moschata]
MLRLMLPIVDSIENVIICTNAEFRIDRHLEKIATAQLLTEENMLYFESGVKLCYTFNGHIISKLKQKIKEYSKNLQNQQYAENFDEDIINYLRNL